MQSYLMVASHTGCLDRSKSVTSRTQRGIVVVLESPLGSSIFDDQAVGVKRDSIVHGRRCIAGLLVPWTTAARFRIIAVCPDA